MRRARYVLTARAAADLREARAWSRARWGKDLTNRYFDDLHRGVQLIAENQLTLVREERAGRTDLLVYPVREHYVVYEPLDERFIAVVAVIRQGRDLPAILRKWSILIRRELLEIRGRIERGETPLPKASAVKGRRRA
ncbi:MAG: type II toxin-antitoxin system RelE/ParE family toxin [Steroidobacteraceae bacterium]